MELGLRDRVAVVLGGSRGLGKAIARELARERARVVLAARSLPRLREAAEEIRRETGATVLPLVADVTQEGSLEQVVEEAAQRWGRVDIAVANAGGPPVTTVETSSLDQFRYALELNLLGTVRLAKAVIPHMKRQRWGRFVAIASVAARQPMPGLVLSTTARAGVLGFVKAMAVELAPHNVLCHTVLPGYIRTRRLEELARERAGREGREPETVLAEYAQLIPLGRLGDPQDVADLVAFLVSDRARYLTGTAIPVDGGLWRGI